ncbi:MAG: hypothetical protein GZ094_03855 [Mariniphaga sp.]|nr:hypothetical protein [Mariniphaga sp.]
MINAIDLRTLRNVEFLRFGADFYGLVNANDPVVLNIEPQHVAFKIKLDETSQLFKLEQSSPLTQELVLDDERRDKAINGISGMIESYCYHFDSATVKAANLLLASLNLYGKGVAKMNLPSESGTIDAIVKDWETKPELTAAITLLGLTAWVAELKAANQLFEQKYLERTEEYGAANPDTLKSKREETVLAYYELRKFIDANSVLNPSAAYEKLINALNALIDQYITLLNTRAAEPETETEKATVIK